MRKRRAVLAVVIVMAGLAIAPPAAATGPAIHMPSSKLADENFAIRVTGLPAGETVTITAAMADDLGRPWSSQASFTADSHGRVNLRHDEPLPGGSYADDDEMGLFYSMRLDNEVTLSPFGFNKFTAAPTLYTFTFAVDGAVIGTRQFEQVFAAEGVTRTVIDTAGVKGVLHLPATAPGPEGHPAIIAITGSDGGLGLMLEARSALLASHGYVVLNLPYFNYEGLPAVQENIPLEYFGNAITWLKGHPWVDGERVGITGASRGGEGALLIASTYHDIKAVVASTPIGVVWPSGLSTAPGQNPPPAWSLGGQPLTTVDVTASNPDFVDLLVANRGTQNFVDAAAWASDAVAAAPNVDQAAIKVEQNTDCEYLLIMGEDDRLWPSRELSQISVERMEDAGLESNIDVHSFDDAGHIILLPNQPTTYDHYFLPMPYGVYFALGGTPEGSHRANRVAWEHTLDFLGSSL
ncbi:acyl-CoA thioester hydrolase/BAAT C-terminal domain-containing protein [Actinokineospora sp. 24-640]